MISFSSSILKKYWSGNLCLCLSNLSVSFCLVNIHWLSFGFVSQIGNGGRCRKHSARRGSPAKSIILETESLREKMISHGEDRFIAPVKS